MDDNNLKSIINIYIYILDSGKVIYFIYMNQLFYGSGYPDG